MSRQPRFPRHITIVVGLLLGISGTVFGQVKGLDDLAGPWQLFVDDSTVADKIGVTRTYHPFQKYAGNPVLTPTELWEENIAYIYGTVMPNESLTGYRMWYHTLRVNDPDNDGSNILYAESTDGINWTKPNLGIRSWHDSTANNMIFVRPGASGITSVMHTPWDADPNKQYRLMNYDIGGFWGAYSNDGVHTFDLPNNPVITQAGDVGQFMHDSHTDLYRGYVKLNSTVNGLQRRSLGLTSTTEIDSWPTPELILEVDTYDDRWVPAGTIERTHIYGMSTFAYESMYMGLLWIFRATDVDGYYIGPVYSEIASSRDGMNWTREEAPRPAMLPLGSAGEWDDGQLYTAKAPIRVGNELWIYYGACDDVHGTAVKKLNCSIGLATLRKDGFASLDAGTTTGTVTTKKILGASGPLHVNYKANSGGSIKVEVLDADDNVIPGYSQSECAALTGDGIDEIVTWTTQTELPGTLDPISLHLIIQNAAVYSFNAGEAAEVVNSPTITIQPVGQTVALGGTAVLTVAATGDSPLSYQWQKNSTDITDGGHYSGTATETLTVSNAALSDEGSYRCVVTNPLGSTTSNVAVLDVSTIIPIDFHETWDSYAIDTSDPAYVARWESIAGTSRYPIQAWDTITPPNTAKVTKEVTLGISHPLATELAEAIPGAIEVRGTNDDPLMILYQNYLNSLNSNSTADVFVELSMGNVHAPTVNSATVLPVLAFGLTAGLHGPASYPRFFDGRNWNSVTSISINNNWNYFSMSVKDTTALLQGLGQASGSATLTRQYTGGFDRISFRTGLNTGQWRAIGDVSLTGGVVVPPEVPPTIDEQPVPAIICPGGTGSFTVNASGTDPLSYQWQKNNVDLTNGGHYFGATTSTLTISNTDTGDVADYRCVVTNDSGSVPSGNAALTLKTTCPADLDHDCDVDASDLTLFANCVSGPQVPAGGQCQSENFDGDSDVDQSDFGIFQRCYTGVGGIIDPNCAD